MSLHQDEDITDLAPESLSVSVAEDVVQRELTIAWVLLSLTEGSLQWLTQPHSFVASFVLRAACAVFAELARAQATGLPATGRSLHYVPAQEVAELAEETCAALQDLTLEDACALIQRLLFMSPVRLSSCWGAAELDTFGALVRMS